MVEVQEPTDFTIQPEYFCGDYRLNDQEMYLGLDPETALSCFHYHKYGTAVVDAGRKAPRVLSEENGYRREELIGEADTPCFAMHRHILTDATMPLDIPASVWICTEGEGEILSEGECTRLSRGDYFFLPAAAAGKCSAQTSGTLTLVSCVGGK